MIEFHNGHRMEFCCASGALGFTGDGYWWEQPLRWLGLIDPTKLTVITKTLTYLATAGNLDPLRPWKCVKWVPGGVVNAVGLTNPGIDWWVENCYARATSRYSVIVSVRPNTIREAVIMARILDRLPNIKGIEINASCPNTGEMWGVERICNLVLATAVSTRHPVIVKLGFSDPYLPVCASLDGLVAAFDLINAVPWHTLNPSQPSPLAKEGLVGGVSGSLIQGCAREALWKARMLCRETPIISGGGIDSYEEVVLRKCLGAKAFSFGTLFLQKPWLPNRIIKRCQHVWKNKAEK